jgi:hypothetical protein
MWLLTATTVFRKMAVCVVHDTYTKIPWNQTSCKSEQKMYTSIEARGFTWHPSRDQQHHRRQGEVSVQVQDLQKCWILTLVSRPKESVKLIKFENKFWSYRLNITEWRIKLQYRPNVELRIFHVSSRKILPMSWNLLRQCVQDIWHNTGKDEQQE